MTVTSEPRPRPGPQPRHGAQEPPPRHSPPTTKAKAPRPDLDTLYSVRADGSRNMLHPADVRGRFQRRKNVLWTVLIGVYVALPWLTIDGVPVALLDVPHRHFYLFGHTFNAQDFWLAFFLVSGVGFALIVASALFGRLWCGYGCPQTVFLEGVYRRLERWIEGPRARRIVLAAAPWTTGKVLRKTAKWTAFTAVSLVLAHTLLGYFIPARELLAAVTSPPAEHPTAFAFVLGTTAVLLFAFGWFREQTCIVLCPYGRLQGVLYDQDTINVAYDAGRGEPRGKLGIATGDCVDCMRCVQVCPTGIDIRNGTQLECVGCANCIDACDAVMDKLGRPRGLIRYDSLRGLHGQRRRFLRPRVWVYAVLLVAGAAVFAVMAVGRQPFEAVLIRQPGPPYVLTDDVVRNALSVHLVNKQPRPATFTLTAEQAPHLAWIVPAARVELDALADLRLPLVVSVPRAEWRPGREAVVRVQEVGGETAELRAPLLGPGGGR